MAFRKKARRRGRPPKAAMQPTPTKPVKPRRKNFLKQSTIITLVDFMRSKRDEFAGIGYDDAATKLTEGTGVAVSPWNVRTLAKYAQIEIQQPRRNRVIHQNGHAENGVMYVMFAIDPAKKESITKAVEKLSSLIQQ